METSFRVQLQTSGIHADIIAFLKNDKNLVYSYPLRELHRPTQRNPVPHPQPRDRVQTRWWTECDFLQALARGGHR